MRGCLNARASVSRTPTPSSHVRAICFVQVLVGPNAVLAFSREGYTWGSVNARDLLEAGSFPGLWRLGLKHWWFALGEMYRSLFLSAQMKDIQMYLPQIQVPSANLNSSKLKGYTHVPLSEVQVSAALV